MINLEISETQSQDLIVADTSKKIATTRSAAVRSMNVNVILTFGVNSEWEDGQVIFDIKLPVNTKEQNAVLFMHRKLFWRIAKKCRNLGRDPKRLIKISTASDWDVFAQKTGKPTLADIGHPCKWWFGSGRHNLDVWEKALIAEFGFGVDVDMSMNSPVNSQAWAYALSTAAVSQPTRTPTNT